MKTGIGSVKNEQIATKLLKAFNIEKFEDKNARTSHDVLLLALSAQDAMSEK